MYLIRKLWSDMDFRDFGEIDLNSYPGLKINSIEEKNKFIENITRIHKENPYVKFYGAFNGDTMVGGMRFHDFKMNLLSHKISAGGLGSVAVDLLHKKEKVAKEIVSYFIDHYKNLGASMVLLYPFRPDFYKKMGFGFGASMSQYKINPANLPKGPSKSNIVFIKEEEAYLLLNCYNRTFESTNGLIEKYEQEFISKIKNPKFKVVAYKKYNMVQGYIFFEFKPSEEGNFLLNDMVINEFIFENNHALDELLTFLNSQQDQIRHIIVNVQDESFRFLLDDPRNGSNNMFTPVYHETNIQGTGIMYRVINTKALFKDLKQHNFNDVTCRLKLTIKDTFVSENDGSIVIYFENGIASLSNKNDYDVEVTLDIADFSSLITCSVSFKSLYKYGKARISNKDYINTINQIFSTDDKPMCLTQF
ncbi:GNAT family N-acetyltransferase [Clostridium sp.]|uniref:GNAT family N-acetyltransferase n=1 Tax=Clostridium sp. TaxID=1506 RepID=UPI002FCA9745